MIINTSVLTAFAVALSCGTCVARNPVPESFLPDASLPSGYVVVEKHPTTASSSAGKAQNKEVFSIVTRSLTRAQGGDLSHLDDKLAVPENVAVLEAITFGPADSETFHKDANLASSPNFTERILGPFAHPLDSSARLFRRFCSLEYFTQDWGFTPAVSLGLAYSFGVPATAFFGKMLATGLVSSLFSPFVASTLFTIGGGLSTYVSTFVSPGALHVGGTVLMAPFMGPVSEPLTQRGRELFAAASAEGGSLYKAKQGLWSASASMYNRASGAVRSRLPSWFARISGVSTVPLTI